MVDQVNDGRRWPGARGDSQDVVDDALEAVDVVADHLRQPALGGGGGILSHERIGLGDGRQGVADFVCDACRHAPHRGQFVLSLACLNLSGVFQEDQANVL